MKKLENGLLAEDFSVQNRALLVSGGIAPSQELVLKAVTRSQFVACADRGAGALIAAGIDPQLIVGDMDSITKTDQEYLDKIGNEVVHLPVEKNDTDTDAAIALLYKRGFDEILMCGAVGGRLDHEQGNMMLICGYGRQGKSLVVWDEKNAVRYINEGTWFVPKTEASFSLIPMSDEGMRVSLSGFYYPLDRERISFGSSRCISNRIDESYGLVTIHSGDGLMFLSVD